METIEYRSMHEQEQRFWWYRALHLIMIDRLQRLSLPTQAQVLDAGCGTGGLLKKLHRTFPHMALTGIEFHRDGIQHLKTLNQTSIINGTVNAMPFDSNIFDALTLADVLYHKNIKPKECLSECLRVLKPQGYLLVNVSAYNWMLSTHDKQVHTRERYTATRLRQQLQDAGFTVLHAGYWNSLLFPLMVIHRLTSGKLKQSSDVESLPAWQDNAFFKIIHCEQFLQRHHIHLPFGGSAWALAIKT